MYLYSVIDLTTTAFASLVDYSFGLSGASFKSLHVGLNSRGLYLCSCKLCKREQA